MSAEPPVSLPPTLPTMPRWQLWLLFPLPLVLAIVGIVLANMQNAPPVVRAIGFACLVVAIAGYVVRVILVLTRKRAGRWSGPYALVPTGPTWRQLGYSDHPFPRWATINAFVNGDLLDLIGTESSAGVLVTVLRSQLIAIRPRLVEIGAEQWWGIAIQRLDKPDDLEFGIRIDQRDAASAEQRATEAAAQLTRAMRLSGAPSDNIR